MPRFSRLIKGSFSQKAGGPERAPRG
jgi:hypothetical protein